MDWDEYEEKGLVRKASVDKEHIRSLLKMSQAKLDFAAKQAVDENSSSIILVLYYDALREVCEALAILNGFKVYSHEALVNFLKYKLSEGEASQIFNRYRRLRNGVNYYGKPVSTGEAVKACSEIPALLIRLKGKYLKEFDSSVSDKDVTNA